MNFMRKSSGLSRTTTTGKVSGFLLGVSTLSGIVLLCLLPFSGKNALMSRQVTIELLWDKAEPGEINERLILPLEKQLSASLDLSDLESRAERGTGTLLLTFDKLPDHRVIHSIYQVLHLTYRQFPQGCPFPVIRENSYRDPAMTFGVPSYRLYDFTALLKRIPWADYRILRNPGGHHMYFVVQPGWKELLQAGGLSRVRAALPEDSMSQILHSGKQNYPAMEIGKYIRTRDVEDPNTFSDGQPVRRVELHWTPPLNPLMASCLMICLQHYFADYAVVLSDDLQTERGIFVECVIGMVLPLIFLVVSFRCFSPHPFTIRPLAVLPFRITGWLGWIHFLTQEPLSSTGLSIGLAYILVSFFLITFEGLSDRPDTMRRITLQGIITVFLCLLILPGLGLFPAYGQPAIKDHCSGLLALLLCFLRASPRNSALPDSSSILAAVPGILVVSFILFVPRAKINPKSGEHKNALISDLLNKATHVPEVPGTRGLRIQGILPPGYSKHEAYAAFQTLLPVNDQKGVTLFSSFNDRPVINYSVTGPLNYLKQIRQQTIEAARHQSGIEWVISGVGESYFSKPRTLTGSYTLTLEGFDLMELERLAEQQVVYLSHQSRIREARVSQSGWFAKESASVYVPDRKISHRMILPDMEKIIAAHHFAAFHLSPDRPPVRNEFFTGAMKRYPAALPVLRKNKNYRLDLSFVHYGNEKYARRFFNGYQEHLDSVLPPGYQVVRPAEKPENRRIKWLKGFGLMCIGLFILEIIRTQAPVRCFGYFLHAILLFLVYLLFLSWNGWTPEASTLVYLPPLFLLHPALRYLMMNHAKAAIMLALLTWIASLIGTDRIEVILFQGITALSLNGLLSLIPGIISRLPGRSHKAAA